jgi:hypothetical protein
MALSRFDVAPLIASAATKEADDRTDTVGRTNSEKDAVLIVLTSRRTPKQVADDLGVGMSTMNKWITVQLDTDVASKEDLSLT